MILDAGGGTVDITCHTCMSRGGSGHVMLAEVTHAVGALCGSTFVDEAFRYREWVLRPQTGLCQPGPYKNAGLCMMIEMPLPDDTDDRRKVEAHCHVLINALPCVQSGHVCFLCPPLIYSNHLNPPLSGPTTAKLSGRRRLTLGLRRSLEQWRRSCQSERMAVRDDFLQAVQFVSLTSDFCWFYRVQPCPE